MRILPVVLGASLLVAASAYPGTCYHSFIAEGAAPPAFDGINLGETGFTSYLWAWGASISDQGNQGVGFDDDGSGIAVNPGFLWANSDNCSEDIAGVGLLIEAQTSTEGGKLTLVAVQGAEIHLDIVQAGVTQSVAELIPEPQTIYVGAGSDGFGEYIDYGLSWAPPTGAWALSNISDVLAGYAVYLITASGGGPVDTGDKGGFTRVGATATDATPYITDDPDTDDGLLPESQPYCTIRVRPGDAFFFSLSLIFDGSGAASEPQADESAVETTYVSACTRGLRGQSAIFADGFESGDTTTWSDTSG